MIQGWIIFQKPYLEHGISLTCAIVLKLGGVPERVWTRPAIAPAADNMAPPMVATIWPPPLTPIWSTWPNLSHCHCNHYIITSCIPPITIGKQPPGTSEHQIEGFGLVPVRALLVVSIYIQLRELHWQLWGHLTTKRMVDADIKSIVPLSHSGGRRWPD